MPSSTHTIAGDMMDDGYSRGPYTPRNLTVEIADGAIYDVDDYGHRITRLHITPDARLAGWGTGVTFSPDEGEMARVGLA
jgi:hypothetical protein